MRKVGIAIIIAGLLVLTSSVICKVAYSEQSKELVEAVRNAHMEIVKSPQEKPPEANTAEPKDHMALIAAADTGRLEVVKLLLDKGYDPNANFRETALHAASRRGHVEVVELLLDRGADVNAVEGMRGRTPLDLILDLVLFDSPADNSRVEVARVLIGRGAHPWDVDRIMFWVINGGNYEIAKLLMKRAGANMTDNRTGEPPLIWAARGGETKVVRLFLEAGDDINSKYLFCRGFLLECALMVASEAGQLDVVKLLVDKGVDVNVRDRDGYTALKLAQKRGSKEIVELLKAHGAKE